MRLSVQSQTGIIKVTGKDYTRLASSPSGKATVCKTVIRRFESGRGLLTGGSSLSISAIPLAQQFMVDGL